MSQTSIYFTAYDNAIGFANAFRLLSGRTSLSALSLSQSYSDFSMVMPTIVNGAFACELFLKALLTDPPQRGKEAHSIVSLIDIYDKEKRGAKEYIREACIKGLQNKLMDNSYSRSKYERDLSAIDKAFVILRYWHDPIKSHEDPRYNNGFNLDFLDVLVTVLQYECEKGFGKRPINQ